MSVRALAEGTSFAEIFYREIISDADALDRLAHVQHNDCSACALHCLHRGMCLSGIRVLEGQCPWCMKPFTSRGTHWAACGRCNVLWRAKVIPAPPCTHNTDPNACDLCCGPEDHPRDVTVIECLPIPLITFNGDTTGEYITNA